MCTWPEQRKRYVYDEFINSITLCSLSLYRVEGNLLTQYVSFRGPAKGYIEGLEHRLHEAETLLLQLLPTVTPQQLESATAGLSSTHANSRDSPDQYGRSSPPMLNKKTGIEYWDTFPLATVENIRRWQQDCALHSQFRDDLAGSSRNGSRPNSIDISRENAAPPSRKPNTVPQYRSMSSDSYTATSQSEYMNAQPQTHAMYTGQSYGQGYDQQHWQQQQQVMNMANMQRNTQQVAVPSSGAMDVEHGFFPGEVKRTLFW